MSYIIINEAMKAFRERETENFTIGSRADLYKYAWDAGRAAGVKEAQPKWISVDADQKPQHGKEYLCVCSLPDDPKHEWDWIMVLRWYAYGTNGYVDRPHFTDEGLNGMIVTHWMELPKRPKEIE